MRKVIIITALIFGYSTCQAQDKGYEIYAHILSNLSQVNTLSYRATFNYFDDVNQDKPNEVLKAQFSMKDSLYYWKVGGKEIQKSNRFITIVDHDEKALMVDYAYASTYTNSYGNKGIDSMLRQLDSIADISTPEQSRIRVYVPNPGISYLEINYDSSSNWFSQISIFFTENRDGNENPLQVRNMLKIEYHNISNTDDTHLAQLQYSTFFALNGKQLKPKGKLANYSIINHLN